MANKTTREDKERLVKILINSYLPIFDDHYVFDKNTYYRQHYEKYHKIGSFAGMFHTHSNGSLPTDDDLEITKDAKGLRVFVISDKNDFFAIHELRYGKIVSETRVFK